MQNSQTYLTLSTNMYTTLHVDAVMNAADHTDMPKHTVHTQTQPPCTKPEKPVQTQEGKRTYSILSWLSGSKRLLG